MTYCTQTDILKQIPSLELAELTTENGSTPDADVVAEAIAKADAEINSYLGVRYVVPFSSASVGQATQIYSAESFSSSENMTSF
jgi:phage gp36-like protein